MGSILLRAKELLTPWKTIWPNQIIMLRNRGETYEPQIIKAARIKYKDKPNKMQLRTGEEMPAIPFDYVLPNKTSFVYEADDDQFIVFKPEFDIREGLTEEQKEEMDQASSITKGHLKSDGLWGGFMDINTDTSDEGIVELLEDRNYNAAKISLMEDKDERTTFYAKEIEKAGEKYDKMLHWVAQNPEIVLVVATSVAIAIILHVTSQNYGEFIPVLKQLNAQAPALQDALGSVN